ncbi:MAG: hypothetical protein WAN72_14750 [Candidatus Acidiferrales bacterium]
MKRSAGVKISAIVVFIGSGLTLLWSAFLVLGVAALATKGNALPFPTSFGIVLILFMLAFAVWGVATGINLLRLRAWARISMVLFSAFLLVVAVPGILMMLFVPLPATIDATNPELTQKVMATARVGMVMVYAILAVLGVWWLYFFNSRPVKEQFGRPDAPAPASQAVWGAPAAAAVSEQLKRPLSITIIAYVSLLGACVLPLIQLMHVPMMFMGIFYTGWKASLIIMGFMSVQLMMAYGLLKLEPWGRSLAIYYFNFGIFNSIISVVLPGAQARFDQAETLMKGTMGLPASPSQAKFPIWTGLLFSLPLIAIQLWFVVKHKQAFERPHGPSARQI